jgi:hypothetical protein
VLRRLPGGGRFDELGNGTGDIAILDETCTPPFLFVHAELHQLGGRPIAPK